MFQSVAFADDFGDNRPFSRMRERFVQRADNDTFRWLTRA
jgi:hypothetical protein